MLHSESPPPPLLSAPFLVRLGGGGGGGGATVQKPSFGRKQGKASSAARKKMFCEFFADASLSLTPASGSLVSVTSPGALYRWSRGWDIKVVDPCKFRLTMSGDEPVVVHFKSESAAEISKWIQTMGAVFEKKEALERERAKLFASVSSSKGLLQHLTSSKATPSTLTSSSTSSDDRRMIEVGLFQYLSEKSKTYADDMRSVDSKVRNQGNELFQVMSEKYLTMDFDDPTPESEHLAVSLISLVEDFLETAQHFGRIIISEVFLPAKSKTIKPVSVGGVIGGEKFIVGNVLFKFAIDMGVFEGDHSSAAKVAGLELQGLRAYYGTQMNGLHFPLMAMIDKKGFRLIASSLLPLKELVYGSNDAAHTIFRENAQMNALLEAAGKKLNLKPHMCGMTPEASKLMYSCVDLEGHLGQDGRLYLLDFSRAMPPVTPSRSKPNSHLFEMFRAEFVAKYPIPLCSDAYSRFTFGQPDFAQHNKEVDEAVQRLFSVDIPQFASLFKERFDHYKEQNVDLTKFKISSLMHENGINVRYLGRVVQSLVGDRLVSGAQAVVGFLDLLDDEVGQKRYGDDAKMVEDDTDLRAEDLLVMEMVARVAKDIVRSKLRLKMEQLRVPVDGPFKGVVITTLNSLFSLNKESTEFWTSVLLPNVERKFGFDLKQLYKGITRKALFKRNQVPFLMWQRICDMLGLQFAPTIRELMQSEPAIFDTPVIFSVADLVDLGDRVKSLDFVLVARGFLESVKASKLEQAGLVEEAVITWKKAEGYLSDSLASRPDDSLRLAMVARVLTQIARLTKASPDSVVIKRALSLSEKANTMVTPSTEVGVALAHAGVLEIGGQIELCEEFYMKTVMKHSDSLPCLSAYTRFLKQYGSSQLAESLEQEVPALRKHSAPAAVPSPRVNPEKQAQLLSMRDKRDGRLAAGPLADGSSSPETLGKKKRESALKAISGSKHQGLGDFKHK